MTRLLILGAVLVLAAPAHDPITTNLTWSKEISRLVYQHCASCHRPGGRAMSLLNYEEARPWAKAIRDEVLNRRMPPWDAVKGFGQFRDDPSLSQVEMDMVVGWVEGGAPLGNPVYLPAASRSKETALEEGGRGIAIRKSTVLSEAMTLRGIRPLGVVEASAILPDQRVEHLIWIPVFHGEWNRTYYLRTPLRLQRGTKIVVSGAGVQLE